METKNNKQQTTKTNNKMSTITLHEPSKKNAHYGSYRFGSANSALAGGRAGGYSYDDVEHALKTAKLDSSKRWCKMKIINPYSRDEIHTTWLDRIIQQDKTDDNLEILLIMKEGFPLHENAIKMRAEHIAANGNIQTTLYKIALLNRKTNNIIFRTIVEYQCSEDCQRWSIKPGRKIPTLKKTKTDNWYQMLSSNGRQQKIGADVKFWKRLKKIIQ